MGRTVSNLRYDEVAKLWSVTATRGDGEIEVFRARHVLSSAPVRELMNALEPKPLSLFNARDLKYRDFLTVVLIGRPQKELPDNWSISTIHRLRSGASRISAPGRRR